MRKREFEISVRRAMLIGALAIIGCSSSPNVTTAPATQQALATDINPATTQPSYWLDQPGEIVRGRDFDRMWEACEDTARDFLFEIDRTDYRAGLLTTKPLTSSQWFEFWRPDVRTLGDLERSTIATTRRTIRFEFTKPTGAGEFSVEPKVLVERETVAEQRITSVVSYRGLFQRPIKVHDQEKGTIESDEGVELPWRYWTAIGRDSTLEDALTKAIQGKLRDM